MKSIAIDGPSGSGKSTIARIVAKKLKFIHVDTGAIYRAVALHMLESGIATSNREAVAGELCNITLDIKHKGAAQRIFLNGRDVSRDIRTSEVSKATAEVSAYPEVREFLLGLQRQMAEKYNVIMDGRDIGTIVLPNADLKIFLTASAEARAKRRHNQLIRTGVNISLEQVIEEIKQRDYIDSNRDIAPLKAADDAKLIDTSNDELNKSVGRILAIVKKAIA